MEFFHAILDALINSILITGLVVVMMMMIESFNIESHGAFFNGLRRSRIGQIVVSAILGIIPGCMGGFAVVSLYTHRMMSFGALIAMLIASSGDEAFVMLAMFPDKALWIMLILFVLGIVAGLVVDLIHDARHRSHCQKESHLDCGDHMHCEDGFEIHCCEEDGEHDHTEEHHHFKGKKHFGAKRIAMFVGVAVFIGALAGGLLAHDHEHGHEAETTEMHIDGHHHDCGCAECGHNHEAEAPGHHHGHSHGEYRVAGINPLSEDWMNVFFAILSLVVLAVLLFGSDHFVEEHLWNHIIRKHLGRIFAWTFGVLVIIALILNFVDIGDWITEHKGFTALMIVLATLIGIIPESGPHLIFVTLFALYVSVPELNYLDFLPVLLASCISQDGHASIPLLAESKLSFLKAKAINCAVALAVGFASWGIVAVI